MCYNIFRWLVGYKVIRQVEEEEIPYTSTHILRIKSESFMKVRNYDIMDDFSVSKVRSFDVAYNKNTDEVIAKNYTNFEKLRVSEFLHVVVPNEKLHIYHISRDSYLDNTNIYDLYYILEPDENYMCKCTYYEKSQCLYHNFIFEKLYSKYIKNDSSSENSDFCNKHDNDRCVV